MTNKIIVVLAALLLSAAAWAGDLACDNLTVNSNATIYGQISAGLVAGTNGTNEASATGGNITTNGNYRIHTFTNNGTFTVSSGSLTCDVLIVAGGGGGGHNGGGGGGGGVIVLTNATITGAVTVVVGTGGAGATLENAPGTNGGNSSFSGYEAIGGGGGGAYTSDGLSGGSGGGGSGNRDPSGGSGGSGTSGQGYAGGNGYHAGAWASGGGGGASATGANASSASVAGQGGDGIANDFSGSSYKYGGGGGGGVEQNNTAGAGGADGGGAGANNSQSGTSGAANSGGGGGGASASASAHGGNGGAGIVIVRYLNSSNSYVSTFTVSSNGISQTGSSGANVFMANVGIGTNNPAEKLHVLGNVKVDGAITLGGETRTNWPSGAQGALMASSNLADVADAAAARANLGIGTAATNDNSAFLAPAGNGSQLTGLTAAQAGALAASNNLSDVASVPTARSNLGLGSAATNNADAFLSPTGDGSQLTGLTATQVGALSTNGGVVNGAITFVAPAGDIPMGVYTNQ